MSKGLTTKYLRTYRVYVSMLHRCRNVNHPNYASYGGRGITVCERWLSFEHFLNDLGPQPAGMQLDRINNDKGYSPDNCRWATRKQNSRNTRRNHILVINGESACISEWAERAGINKTTLLLRIRRGWSPEQAVSSSVRQYK